MRWAIRSTRLTASCTPSRRSKTSMASPDLNPGTARKKTGIGYSQPSEWEPATARRSAVGGHGGRTVPRRMGRHRPADLQGRFSASNSPGSPADSAPPLSKPTVTDREGRRLLPTILKISTLDFTRGRSPLIGNMWKSSFSTTARSSWGQATRGQWAGCVKTSSALPDQRVN
jgi:hypothetical protein